MSELIHPTAIIDPSAQVEDGVSIGPFAVIGANAEIGAGTRIASHVVIGRNTRIGKDNNIFQFASVGEDPQDLKFAGEDTWLEIGDRNTIRESCTIHRGTTQDEGLTRIGSDNLMMAYTHIAHDCQIGNDNVLSTQATVAGHVKVGNGANIGGLAGIHQFCHIGSYCMIGGGSIVLKDVPAYVMTGGNPASAFGMNFVGMKRRDYSRETIANLKEAYKLVYRNNLTLEKALEEVATLPQSAELDCFVESIKKSTRGILR